MKEIYSISKLNTLKELFKKDKYCEDILVNFYTSQIFTILSELITPYISSNFYIQTIVDDYKYILELVINKLKNDLIIAEMIKYINDKINELKTICIENQYYEINENIRNFYEQL